ncbi:MAG: methylenetetrahydrofolate--tRNA-(uracil(54)-C(5))-methyltransferase (FADH(2)-oxidizing) TrmFO [Holophagales bacterium]|nr:methylenetetrahydrofolate--tRNA-(uracil(54)-C(5))-methyltransferase (FADH(2)-oxidizing) TrmFO [Holophagales bacterium]MYC08941.1 methylenetetrahydrofolate--tRNA-(uracil(54)-C(5))-methyltransferase (FADH(2)-oxidizing) TrmFO [Holophagales bacterium]
MTAPVVVVGGGLAGSECAFQLASRGRAVTLYEMRPQRSTPAHASADLAELVCSNSLRSDDPNHAAGLLKREMEHFGSLIIAAARRNAVPAGGALAVDRTRFAADVTAAVESHPLIELRREELTALPEAGAGGDCVIATGPLTSEALTREIENLIGADHLYFYDAIAPIVVGESLDHDRLFRASRYGKGGDDYLNCPLGEEEYRGFRRSLLEADTIKLREFERPLFFEGCLPIEELARRGEDTLRFGPMKPVGLRTPDGERPHAVVQLRQEDLARSQYNLVGFQSRMTWPEQRRVLRTLPGLSSARFVRYGQVHRNTFINAPLHLDRWYRFAGRPNLRLAGQMTGVEGYLESAATGLVIALYLALQDRDRQPAPLPDTTALGALARHLTESNPKRYQPTNINYGLLEPLAKRVPRRERRAAYVDRAQQALVAWAGKMGLAGVPSWESPTMPSQEDEPSRAARSPL